tara:strand:- start:530 stop:778 length:249 start_codon:yes stop_codon:yes gene_type:complete
MTNNAMASIITKAFNYLVEGLVVAVVAYVLPQKKLKMEEVFVLGAVASCTFAILDVFAPAFSSSVRSGAGLGMGAKLVGFPM